MAENVQSLERAFGLLEALADAGRPLGVTELAGASGLPVGTIHRLLQTLVNLGYVRQAPARTYELGPGLVRLGVRATSGVVALARPLLTDLAERIGESVNLATLEGTRVVYLAHVPSSRSMRMFTEVGSRVPAHTTGVGKAMLARMPDAAVAAWVEECDFAPVTPRTVTDAGEFTRALAEVRRHRYAVDDEEQELGVRCVAVAVPGEGEPLAVSTSGPTARMSDDVVARVVPWLTEVAQQIADEMRRTR